MGMGDGLAVSEHPVNPSGKFRKQRERRAKDYLL
jgi:hypothetical protein